MKIFDDAEYIDTLTDAVESAVYEIYQDGMTWDELKDRVLEAVDDDLVIGDNGEWWQFDNVFCDVLTATDLKNKVL